ncbi:MAG: ribonuclease H [Actinomycetota bacterium]
MPDFTCNTCGRNFSLPQHVLDRYPGWAPKQCRSCRDSNTSTSSPTASADDPQTGVFTDGGCTPNPGPGGWGAVYVVDGEIIEEAFGHDPDTTNNRMELTALIEGARLVPDDTPVTVYSDSNLAVRTINEWAAGWEKRGWKRKTGPVENLDLVRRSFTIYRKRPELELQWIKAHVGHTWNEYADRLANRWRES